MCRYVKENDSRFPIPNILKADGILHGDACQIYIPEIAMRVIVNAQQKY